MKYENEGLKSKSKLQNCWNLNNYVMYFNWGVFVADTVMLIPVLSYNLEGNYELFFIIHLYTC